MTSKADNYYTTNPKDMSKSGYRFEGITGYLYPEKFANTVPLHHLFHPLSGDNFYTLDKPQTSPNSDGYEYKGKVGYIYRHPTRGTAPLLRWWLMDQGDHFYTTHPSGELAPDNYVFEGVTGYMYPEPVEGTVPLFRWYKRPV